jgi:hypothetical protein
MPTTKPRLAIIVLQHSSFNPNDSTTYYCGAYVTSAQTTPTIGKYYPVIKGKIIRAQYDAYNDVNTSNEPIEMYIRKNDTSDTTLSTTVNFAGGKTIDFGVDINLDIDVTDFIELKYVTPAWATNPTNWRARVLLLMII